MDSWARVEISEDDQMFISQEDVKDFFYRLGIGQDLGEYFSLPPINPKLLQDELGSIPADVAKLGTEGANEHVCSSYGFFVGFSFSS